jgi:uncharacterized protein YpmB
MLSEETKDRIIEIIIVVQLAAILMAIMLYYFSHRAPQQQCEAQSSPVVQKSAL